MEMIAYLGRGSNDNLTVDLGDAATQARVDAGSLTAGFPTDRLASDALPVIEFADDTNQINNFTVLGGAGAAKAVTFVTSAIGASANFFADLGPADTLIIEGSDAAADNYTVDDPDGMGANNGPRIVDNVSGVFVQEVTGAAGPLGRLQINTLGGNDTVNVSVSNTDLLTVPIVYDGGTGADLLTVQGTPATDVTTVTYTPGADPTDGKLTYDTAAADGVMSIEFTNLQPVLDLVPATSLIVNGNNADNAISYTQGNSADRGLVAVDGFETIEFSNKEQLTLNGLAGSDEFSLNNAATPANLAGITVNGGDPTAGSDTVIVNGTAAANAIIVDTLTIDGAQVTGAQGVPVTVATAEKLIIDGQGGDDTLTHTSPNGSVIDYFPGPSVGEGSIFAQFNDSLLDVGFEDLGAFATITFASDSGAASSRLDYHGTDADDVFNVSAAGLVELERFPSSTIELDVNTPGISQLVLIGQDGDDRFNVPGDHPFTAGLITQGGNPDDGSDVLNFSGAGAAITVGLAAKTITENFTVTYSGIETAIINAAAGDVNVNGTAGDDSTVVTPTGANSATLVNNDETPTFNLSGIGTLLVNQLAGDDTLRVDYTSASEAIAVNVPAGSIGDGTLETVTFANVNTEAVQVFGNEGNDAFTVTADPNIPIFIDGGDPIGSSPGDSITIVAGGDPVIAETGPENDEGGFIVGANARVSFDHIEAIGVVGAMKAYIAGTNADDDITIIARDASTHAGADGVQDFTSTVNAGPSILWIDTPQLVVDALAGDDDIVARVPRPNNANWNVQAWILGGALGGRTGRRRRPLRAGNTSVQRCGRDSVHADASRWWHPGDRRGRDRCLRPCGRHDL